MTANLKLEALSRAVVELIELEGKLERTLGARPSDSGADAELTEALRRFGGMAAEHRAALEAYLASIGGTPRARGWPGEPCGSAIAALTEAYGLLNDAAIRYGVLTTMAFRLHELPLRELAPKHLRDCAQAAQRINQLIPSVVAAELRGRGLECQCVCPMCSFGACGCVAISTRHINAAWRETAPPDAPPGLLLQPPRPDSDLARAGIRGGEVLLAVDDRAIRDNSDVQAALREHARGQEVRLRIRRPGEEPTEVCVSQAGDAAR